MSWKKNLIKPQITFGRKVTWSIIIIQELLFAYNEVINDSDYSVRFKLPFQFG